MPEDNDNRSAIDWETIFKSLDWDDEERRRALEQQQLRSRARQYAAPTRKTGHADEGQTVLTFDLGSELYGVDVMLVRSVRALPRIARVPGTPSFYRGVVNLRGQITTVMDLRLFLELPAEDNGNPPGELVVVRSNNLEIGLLAHNVHGVVTVPNTDIEPASDMRYVLGVTTSRLVVLNIMRLFEDNRLMVGGREE